MVMYANVIIFQIFFTLICAQKCPKMFKNELYWIMNISYGDVC